MLTVCRHRSHRPTRCGRASRVAIRTNHPFDRAWPDPDSSGSLTTTRKSDDDVTTKPPPIARFPRGHAARMQGIPLLPFR